MCGIIYAQSLNGLPVNELVWDQYQKQKNRGQEGFGVFNGSFTVKAAMEKRIKKWLAKPANESDMLLFHHRYPTSTINTKRAAHPFNTGDYFGDTRYVLVHNGTIDNSDELRKAHEDIGISYQSVLEDKTFNDSESLLWDVALTMEGKQKELNAHGGIAFICIKLVNNVPERMYFGRNHGRPLKLLRTKEGIMLSSEGEGEEIKAYTMYNYNYAKRHLSNRYFRIPAYDPKWRDEKWNSRSEYKGYKGTYGTHTNAASGYTNSNNVCAIPPRSVSRWEAELDEDDFYLDDYGYTWFGREAAEQRALDNEARKSRSKVDSVYEDYDYEIPKEGGGWETIKARIQMASNRNLNKISTNPELIGNIIAGREPTKDEVNVRMFKEIGRAEGNYGVAYWHLVGAEEMMRESIKQSNRSSYYERSELKLMAATMDAILADPNNDSDGAVHPMWATDTPIVNKKQLTLGNGVTT